MPQGKSWQKEVNRLKWLLTESSLANRRLRTKYERSRLMLEQIDEQRGFILDSLPDPQLYELFKDIKKFLKQSKNHIVQSNEMVRNTNQHKD